MRVRGKTSRREKKGEEEKEFEEDEKEGEGVGPEEGLGLKAKRVRNGGRKKSWGGSVGEKGKGWRKGRSRRNERRGRVTKK